ncbi:enoyl-CoA hydratase/isomerase family protein [Deinococcus deserti]|uniref:Putative enoyl-CoA hydratase (Enoyl hydrase) (Unsaturated acyl-CoA hydratase) n=1 Tax=Deinococcus deserti (strain DSM 17065 / CIP 109153 / LMG 22923 / VCD115) TaxID=546414 RepID=C1CY74_DEIDV|nr:enoyl-CoA hydratase/isomerase family protein [Deinococcus deserti]ACO47030.1 putative enoyl-CoA hydratase (enoyl hydrase) (unsaturated acyl-CoA hydratase) [Deinococcus deserti VCD115]
MNATELLSPDRYPGLSLELHEDGILEIVIRNERTLNSVNAEAHRALTYIWRDIDAAQGVRCVLIRGEGRGFSSGGDFELIEEMSQDFTALARVWREARDLVYNVINCGKPIVSAIHGPCVGAGLAVALLSDVSVAAKTARILDGHVRLGVAAGDHAAIIWPLLCGLNKAKYHLMTGEPVSGEEAERIGLVSLCVEDDQLLDRAWKVARTLAAGSPTAVRWTKYALNNWLRAMGPTFDASLALEFLGFTGPDVREGLSSLREKRAPNFMTDAPI